ncbi:MAG: nucleotidyltransferase family protein [Nanoarchaeota archaeon]
MKAIILAGGLGERLRPLTLKKPKPLLPVNGKPIAEYCLENLKKCGIRDVILSIGYKSEMIEDYFGDGSKLGMNIEYNIEKELLGTGGAVKFIVDKFGLKEKFLLVWGDNLMNIDFTKMVNIDGKIVMCLTEREDVENFGVAKIENDEIIEFVEKPERSVAPSNLINAGGFVIEPSVLDILPEGKSSIERDCFEKIKGIKTFIHEGYWYPTDTMEKYEFAEAAIVKELGAELKESIGETVER